MAKSCACIVNGNQYTEFFKRSQTEQGMPVFIGRPRQKGRGLGQVISKIALPLISKSKQFFLSPLVKKGLSSLGGLAAEKAGEAVANQISKKRKQKKNTIVGRAADVMFQNLLAPKPSSKKIPSSKKKASRKRKSSSQGQSTPGKKRKLTADIFD